MAETGGSWADFGSGSGAFTLALAELLGAGATIYALDRDERALPELQRLMQRHFPETLLHPLVADYTLELPPGLSMLDGVLMANALHFQTDTEKQRVLARVQAALRPGGRLIVVEYNTDRGNRWVPHPFSFTTWQVMAHAQGFRDTRLLATRPSRFLGEIFASVSLV